MRTLKHTKLKKSALAAALAVSLGVGSMMDRAYADTYTFSFSGEFTMLTSGGTPLDNTSYSSNSWSGYRTDITGTMTYDTVAGTGSGTITPFNFFSGSSPAEAQAITFQAIGNGTCTTSSPTSCSPGNLLLGNMLFNWSGNNGIPVSIVMDASGLFGAMGSSLVPGSVVQNVGALPASNYMRNGGMPIGPAPVATLTQNTTLIGAACTGTNGASCMGRNPSGGLPLVSDSATPTNYNPTQVGIGGNPMVAGPFVGFNANFDFVKMTVTSKNGVSGPPSVNSTSPINGSTTANPLSTPPITVTFTEPMEDNTVAAALTVNLTGGAAVPGTVSPSAAGQTASTFTFTPTNTLAYSTGYTANISTAALNAGGQALTSAYTWSFTTKAAPVSTSCTGGGPAPATGTAGNFTMLTPTGTPFGGTNDVVYTYTGQPDTTINSNVFNMTLASATPEPFFGFDWSAHNIRVFGTGTWTFNTGCTVAELQAGVMPSACAVQGAPLTMTVGSGQLGALMLFDWHGNDNIYVADVWNQHAQWQSGPGTENGLWTGPAWGGPAGYMVDPLTTWSYASTPDTNNGINGVPMVNGPFIGFSANFNLDATDTCTAAASVPIQAHDTQVSGCTISPTPVNLFKRSDWLILLGFVGWMGWWRKRRA
ncbi:MAG: Ig-like domain-containing domain [Acidiferrobacterales bacterium]